eukprot:4369243-Prymnesium_polylepis.1
MTTPRHVRTTGSTVPHEAVARSCYRCFRPDSDCCVGLGPVDMAAQRARDEGLRRRWLGL